MRELLRIHHAAWHPKASRRVQCGLFFVCLLGAVLIGKPLLAQEDITMSVESRGRDQKASRITLDFVNAEIQQLLRFLSRETNLTIIASSEDIQNKRLSLVNLRNVTVEEALEKIKSGLMQFGLTTIQSDTTLIITTVQKAAKMKVPVAVGSDPARIPDTDAVITQVIPLVNLDASQIANNLKPMVSDAGVLFGDQTSNTIVITDVASNIRRIAQTLKAMDADEEGAGLKVKVIQIKNGSAESIARALNELFREEAQASALVRKAATVQDPAQMQKLLEGARSTGIDLVRGRVQISANTESNQIILKASESNIAIIETLISQMDVAPAIQTEFKVYRLKYATAKTVAEYLQNILTGRTSTTGGRGQQQGRFRPPWEPPPPPQQGATAQGLVGEVRIAADDRLNGIVVATDPRNFSVIDLLIEQIDQQDQPAEEIQIFFLQHGTASAVVETIQTLIQGQREQDNRPWWWDGGRQTQEPKEGVYGLRGQVQLSADNRLNAIVAATSPANLAVLSDLIKRLDVSMPSQEWGTRIFQLKYADATNIANIINTVYQGSSQTRGGGGGFFFFLQQAGRQRNQAQGSLAGNVVAQEYPTTNAVIVSTATARNFELIEKFIQELDVPTPPEQRELTRVFNLEYANASDLASLLSDLWAEQGTTGGGGGGFFNFVRSLQRTSAEQVDVNSLAGKVRLFADTQTNSLVVTTAARYMKDVEELIRQLDIVRGQVWLDVTILEATLDDSTKLGMELALTEKRLFGADAFGKGRAPGKNPLTAEFNSDVNLDQEVTGFTLSLATKEYLAFLHTLMRENKVRTLSRPSVQVRDNQQVVFSSGRDIPYLQSARTSDFVSGQIFDFAFLNDIGINITITPHIARRVATASGKRTIGLEIQQIEASNFIEFTSFNAPVTESSSIQTYIDAEDGQQIVIGGLKKQKKQKVTDKVPLLGDLPLLGRLFKRTEDVTQESEIDVIITPHIININDVEDRARLENLQQERFGDEESNIRFKTTESPLSKPLGDVSKPVPLSPPPSKAPETPKNHRKSQVEPTPSETTAPPGVEPSAVPDASANPPVKEETSSSTPTEPSSSSAPDANTAP